MVNSVSPANSNLHSEHPLSTKWISHEPTAQVFKQKLFQTLPGQKAYLVQVKKKHLFDTLDIFSEVRTMIAWKVVQISKEKESVVVLSKKHQTSYSFNVLRSF